MDGIWSDVRENFVLDDSGRLKSGFTYMYYLIKSAGEVRYYSSFVSETIFPYLQRDALWHRHWIKI